MSIPLHSSQTNGKKITSDRYPSFTTAAKLCMYTTPAPTYTQDHIRTLDPAPRRAVPQDARMGRRRMSFAYFVAAEDRQRAQRAQQAELARVKAELAQALTELHHARSREERTRARRRPG